ncbi:MAG: hypothetical protein KBD76_04945 [Bacteriovorax sp.]|jgi:hypothetical protein|nr:hypothetical protein [Bacteriovorax sp.]
MKGFLFTICFLLSLSSKASICGVENSRLVWTDDTIISQYECKNETTSLCASHAILLGDGIHYFVLAGARITDSNAEEMKSFILLPALGGDEFIEDDLFLIMQQIPEVPFLPNAKKLKTTFSLDKSNGQALYTVESRDFFSVNPWVTQVSEKFRCQNVNEQSLVSLE